MGTITENINSLRVDCFEILTPICSLVNENEEKMLKIKL